MKTARELLEEAVRLLRQWERYRKLPDGQGESMANPGRCLTLLREYDERNAHPPSKRETHPGLRVFDDEPSIFVRQDLLGGEPKLIGAIRQLLPSARALSEGATVIHSEFRIALARLQAMVDAP